MKLSFPSVFCAIDTSDIVQAVTTVSSIVSMTVGVKLGLEFFCAHGMNGVKVIQRAGISRDEDSLPIFLDLKLHDIPITVAKAIRNIVPLKPFMVNVHASGGRAMLKAAVSACCEESTRIGVPRPKLVAVTVLTSLDDSAVAEIVGLSSITVTDAVQRLAELAQDCGLDGVICSGHEVRRLRTNCGCDFWLVVPGIRPTSWTNCCDFDDQIRTMTPVKAIAEGADILVIGRPIMGSPNPARVIQQIISEVTSVQRY